MQRIEVSDGRVRQAQKSMNHYGAKPSTQVHELSSIACPEDHYYSIHCVQVHVHEAYMYAFV